MRFSSLVRSVSQDVFSFAGFGKEWCGRLKLVVDELFMNAVFYGSTQDESIVSIVFSYDEHMVEFSIADDGTGKSKVTPEELRQIIDRNIKNNTITQTSGRGLAMITNFWTDNLSIEKSPAGGILISFSKKIESAPPPPPPLIRAAIDKAAAESEKAHEQPPQSAPSAQVTQLSQSTSNQSQPIEKKPSFLIELHGDIDPFNIERTILPINEAIAKLPDQSILILDFKNVTYINSTFIGQLAAWYKDMRQKHGKIILRNAQDQIKDVLVLVGLDRVLTLES